MKYLKIISLALILMLFSSCISTDDKNIHEFIKLLNTTEYLDLNYEDFALTKNDELIYSYMTQEKSLLSLYSTSTGAITRCSVSSEKNTEDFLKLCIATITAFTNESVDECESAIDRSFAVGKSEISNSVLLTIKNDVGITFIVCHNTDDILSNQKPTLKRHIDEKDISRPTIGENEKLTTKPY